MSSDTEDTHYDQNKLGQGLADEEESLPRATVAKIISDILPPNVQCPRETRDLLMECCVEYIHLLTSEANEICERTGRKTIGPEHIVEALERLGFHDSLEAVRQTLDESLKHLQREKERAKARNKMETSGLSPEELQRQQEELFEQARRKYLESQQRQ